MKCKAALVLCWAVLGRQVVTRRQTRLLHERSEPTEEGFADDEEPAKEESLDSHFPAEAVQFTTKSLDEEPMTDLGNPIASTPQAVEHAMTFGEENSEQKVKLEAELAKLISDIKKANTRSAVLEAHGQNLEQKKKELEKEIADIVEWMKIAPNRKWTPPTRPEKDDLKYSIPLAHMKFPSAPMNVEQSLKEPLPKTEGADEDAESKGGLPKDLKKQIATMEESIIVLRTAMKYPQSEDERPLLPMVEGAVSPAKNLTKAGVAPPEKNGTAESEAPLETGAAEIPVTPETEEMEKKLAEETDAEPSYDDKASFRALLSLWEKLAIACRSREPGDPCQKFLPGVASEQEVREEETKEKTETAAEAATD